MVSDNQRSETSFDSVLSLLAVAPSPLNFPNNIQVTTLFVTSDFGILMQDSFPLEEPLEALLGLQVHDVHKGNPVATSLGGIE